MVRKYTKSWTICLYFQVIHPKISENWPFTKNFPPRNYVNFCTLHIAMIFIILITRYILCRSIYSKWFICTSHCTDKESKKRTMKQTQHLLCNSHERTINSITKQTKNRKIMISTFALLLKTKQKWTTPSLLITPSFAVTIHWSW